MARVVVAPSARDDLTDLMDVLKLPQDTRMRVRQRIGPLAESPESGTALTGRWQGYRFILGPWDWMLIIYAYDAAENQVGVVTIQDSRSGSSARGSR